MTVPTRRRHARFRWLLVGGGLILVSLVAAFLARDDLLQRAVPPAQIAQPAATPKSLSADDSALFVYVGTRLSAAEAECRVLATMGADKSRDVMGLKVRSDRVSARL